MAAAALILLWVQHEYSFDQFHATKDRLYEVWNRDVRNGKTNCWNTTPKPMGPAIQKDYDEVERTVRVNYDFPILFTYGEKRIKASCNIVDSGFLQLFTFPLLTKWKRSIKVFYTIYYMNKKTLIFNFADN